MATRVETLSWELNWRSRNFQRQTRRLRREVRKFARDATRQTQQLAKATAAAATAVVAGYVAMARGSLQFADELTKQSRNINVSVRALSTYGLAFELAGSSQGNFIKGVQNVAKNIQEAGRGMTTYSSQLDIHGLTYEELAGLEPDEQFRRVVEAIQGLDSASQRLGVSLLFVGRTGKELGSVDFGQIDQLAGRLERLGGILTEDQTRDVERFNDNICLLYTSPSPRDS